MPPTQQEQPQKPILDKINEALAELNFDGKWLKAPKYFPEYESLKNKKIVIVDDIVGVLENILPDLIVASDGNTKALHYTNESYDQIIEKITSQQPDIVILDYNLSEEVNGAEIARKLFQSGFTGKIVGSSSDSEKSKEFLKAGAVGNIDKTPLEMSDSIKHLAEITK